jgi:hypothetical protein
MNPRGTILLGLLWGLTLPASADEPTPAEQMADLDRAVSKGIFLVLADEGVNLAVIGRAPEGMGEGPRRRLDNGSGGLIVVAQALRRDHPTSLDTLPRQPVRLVGPDGSCTARLGRVFVMFVMGAGIDAPPVWNDGRYVVAVIERGCRTGLVATTHLSPADPPAALEELTPARLAQAELAFETSAASREASMFRARGGADSGGEVSAHGFRVGESHRLTFVQELIPDIWHCSGRTHAFTMILEERGGAVRRIRAPQLQLPTTGPKLILDLDGDGSLELLFEYPNEGTVHLLELRPDQDQLVPLGSVHVMMLGGC